VETMMHKTCSGTIHKNHGLYIFTGMQGILSMTMPAMRLLGYNPSLLPGGSAGAAAAQAPHTREHAREQAGSQKTMTFQFATLSDLPPPTRWGLNE
jgi:hypothetical protein